MILICSVFIIIDGISLIYILLNTFQCDVAKLSHSWINMTNLRMKTNNTFDEGSRIQYNSHKFGEKMDFFLLSS